MRYVLSVAFKLFVLQLLLDLGLGFVVGLELAEATLQDVFVVIAVNIVILALVRSLLEAETVHLLIKPLDAGLESSAVVTTSRRVYHLRLISRREGFMPYVGFLYPGQLVQRFRAREAEEKAQKARQ